MGYIFRYSVIGDPIEHSLSPFIHGYVIEKLGIDAEYNSFCVKKGQLSDWISQVRHENIKGFNVTMPHKVDIIPFLDEIDEEAKIFNSVNTVKNINGRLKGFSTDAEGFKLSLDEFGVSLEGKTVLFLGAGGVSNTLALKAARLNAKKVIILNRTIEKANSLALFLRQVSTVPIISGDMNYSAIKKYAEECDVLINSTPLGMKGISQNFESFDFLDTIDRHGVVCDLIYNPARTKLLFEAENRGLTAINGLGMLIYQAFISDVIYFEREFDFVEYKMRLCDRLDIGSH